jgi:hypothetical protein
LNGIPILAVLEDVMKTATRFTAAVASLVCMMSVSSAPATAVVTTITDCAFGTAQVFDVKYNFTGAKLNVSSATRPYGNVPNGQIAESDWQAEHYLQFVDSVSNAGTLALERFDSSNVSQGLLDTTGSFRAYGDDFIFYLGDNYYGTLIMTSYGYDPGFSARLSVTTEYPTTAEMLAFTSCLETPLAAGEGLEPGRGGDDDADGLASTGVSVNDPALYGLVAVVIVGVGAVLRRRIRG